MKLFKALVLSAMTMGATVGAVTLLPLSAPSSQAIAQTENTAVRFWRSEWPNTDFEKTTISFTEVLSGGPPRDGIPSIDRPEFDTVSSQSLVLSPTEPVIGLEINGDARAYPLRVLTWHEIVNDTVGGKPVAVTYCPLCNAAIVFDAVIDGQASEFGTTGKLRKSDLIMYDRNSESWWQQFSGEAIVGSATGQKLTVIPSRLESFERFAARFPEGKVLVPNNERMRQYGANPYSGYDTRDRPFPFFTGPLPNGIEALARVVAIDNKAWSLALLRENGTLTDGDLTLTWAPGQNSALDTRDITQGRDVGNVIAQRNGIDVAYDLTFAFVFNAFRPDGEMVF